MAKRPPVRGRRLWKLASMTASVAGDYARSRVGKMVGREESEESLRRRAGERIADTLGEPYAPVPPAHYDRWLNALCPPLWTEGAFDFGAADIGRDVVRLIPSVIKRQHWWKPAPELTMVDRAVAGQYDIVRNFKARIPLRDILLEHIS